MRCVTAVFFGLLAGCGSSDPAVGPSDAAPQSFDARPSTTDAAPVPDATAGPDATVHAMADNLACQRDLAADWAASPPVVGLGSASARASYREVIGKLMDDFAVPGGAVAVSREGKLVLALGLGMADQENAEPAHPDDLFRIASLSKQITAAAILSLETSGDLDVNEPAFAILSDLQPIPGKTRNPQLAQITIRNLLQHTGGWNRDHDAAGDPMFNPIAIADAVGAPRPASCETVIRYMLDKPLAYAPGSATCYSNFGYCVLGRIIERRSGMSYEAYVKSKLLTPAGASDMRIGRSLLADRADGEVRYYDFRGAGLASSIFPSMPGPVPWPYGGFNLEAMDSHGAWIASPVDLLRLQVRVDGRAAPADLLSSARLTEMLADPKVPSCTASGGTNPADPAYWYGFGFSVNQYGNYWHNGSLPGTSTEDVIASNGFSWSAFFNTRPSSSAFFGRLDGDLWTALGGVTTWSTQDYFDQYAPFGEWLAPADYDAAARAAAGAQRYPVRVEGRLATSEVQLRAQFVPLHAGVASSTVTLADCLDFRAAAARAAGLAQELASLQSFTDATGIRRYQATWATAR